MRKAMRFSERAKGVKMENGIEKVTPIAPVIPKINLGKPPVKENKPSAGEMVDQAFNAAIVSTVENDTKVQTELLESAEKVIHNRTNAIKADAEREEKEDNMSKKADENLPFLFLCNFQKM